MHRQCADPIRRSPASRRYLLRCRGCIQQPVPRLRRCHLRVLRSICSTPERAAVRPGRGLDRKRLGVRHAAGSVERFPRVSARYPTAGTLLRAGQASPMVCREHRRLAPSRSANRAQPAARQNRGVPDWCLHQLKRRLDATSRRLCAEKPLAGSRAGAFHLRGSTPMPRWAVGQSPSPAAVRSCARSRS